LGQKRRIKRETSKCFLCGCNFSGYKDKNSFKLNKNKNHSIGNTIVLCEECLECIKADYTLFFNVKFKDILKTVGSKKIANILIKKIYRMKNKFNNEDK
jgi:hypothetical protein